MANGKVATEKSDLAGHIIAKSDLGGHTTNYTYDVAGRMTGYAVVVGGVTSAWSFTWLNSGQRGTVTSSDTGVTTFGYDKLGHIVSEKLILGGVTYKDQTATYDAAGRLTAWADAGGTTIPAASP